MEENRFMNILNDLKGLTINQLIDIFETFELPKGVIEDVLRHMFVGGEVVVYRPKDSSPVHRQVSPVQKHFIKSMSLITYGMKFGLIVDTKNGDGEARFCFSDIRNPMKVRFMESVLPNGATRIIWKHEMECDGIAVENLPLGPYWVAIARKGVSISMDEKIHRSAFPDIGY